MIDVQTDVLPTGSPERSRVSARDVATLVRAARVLAVFPRRSAIELGDVGSVGLTWQTVDALGPESRGEVAFALSHALGVGRLVIDEALAHRVVAVALGGEDRPGAALARLGLGERGVVAGIVASLLHALGAPFSISLVAPHVAEVAKEGGVAIALAVTVAHVAGWARLEVPSAWLASGVPAVVGGADPRALAFEVRVELARTRLAEAELAGVVPGDAIVFDGEPRFAFDACALRAVRVVIGAHASRAHLAENGCITLEDGFRPAPAAPLEVVAELGRLTMTGEEVVGLEPGAVLTLGRLGTAPVALRVGEEIWAEGELVDVDGALGVRVTARSPSGAPTR
jgi:type III secretion protein Q